MPIATLRQQSTLKWAEIGRIRKGAPKEPKRPGRDLDHFRIDSPDPAVNAAFTAAFGPEPKEFTAILPYANVDDLLIANYERWDGATLLARGDGLQVNRWYDPQANAYRSDPLSLGEYNARFGVANPEKEWKVKALLFLLVPQAIADGAAGVLALVTTSIIDVTTLYGNLGVVERVYGQLEGAPVIVRRTPMKLNIPKPDGSGIMVATKWMVSLGVNSEAVRQRYAGGAFLESGNGAAAALPAGRKQLPDSGTRTAVLDPGHGGEPFPVTVDRDGNILDEPDEAVSDGVVDDDDLFSDKEKFVAAMERAPNPEAAVAAAQAWVPRYKKTNVHQAKNALKSVSDSLGFKAWPVNSRGGAVDLTVIRRMIAEALWAYAVLRDTGTESAEALAALAQG